VFESMGSMFNGMFGKVAAILMPDSSEIPEEIEKIRKFKLLEEFEIREKMLGYYNQIMNGEIELFGISKVDFAKIYFGNQKAYEEEYRRTHGFIERELKSSSLANKELKIIKGYLKGNSIVIEDWWKKIAGEDWQASAFHNPAAYNYCVHHQSEYNNHTESVNWVLCGKIGGLGYLVNVNELEWPEGYKPEEDYIFVEKESK